MLIHVYMPKANTMLGGDEGGNSERHIYKIERDEETSLRTYASNGVKWLRGTICVSFS